MLDGLDGRWASDSQRRTAGWHGRTRPSSFHLTAVSENRSDPFRAGPLHSTWTAAFVSGFRMTVRESGAAAAAFRTLKFPLFRRRRRGIQPLSESRQINSETVFGAHADHLVSFEESPDCAGEVVTAAMIRFCELRLFRQTKTERSDRSG